MKINPKILILISLSLLLFSLIIYRLIMLNSELYLGLRGLFIIGTKYLSDFSIYTIKNNAGYWYDSGLGCYLWPWILIKLFPRDLIPLIGVFSQLILALLNVYLLFDLFGRKYKWSEFIIPIAYFFFPSFKFPNVFLITFFLLGFKFKDSLLGVFFGSISAFFFKQYMLIPNLMLFFYPIKFNKNYLLKALVFFGLPLIVYSFYPNSFNALFISVSSHGFSFNLHIDLFFFPSLIILIVVFFNLKKINYSNFIIVSMIFLLFSQSKIGAEYYLGFFSVLFVMVFFKVNRVDKVFLIIAMVLFFLFFLYENLSILVPGSLRISSITMKGLDLLLVNSSISINDYKAFNPLFTHVSVNNISVDSSFNNTNAILFGTHEIINKSLIRELYSNNFTCFIVPAYWGYNINFHQEMVFCFKDSFNMDNLYSFFNYYNNVFNELCGLSNFIGYKLYYLKIVKSPCYSNNFIDLSFNNFFVRMLNYHGLISGLLSLSVIVLYLLIKSNKINY